ncbi:MAG: lantibiotic immunity ABC transporter MutE/EpiE family permease subunit [Caloramator sp.]|nr:lantibiotic immunity ABC transporter MutE/EpiE family permease subunit [Caloramator sp.]
MVNYLKAEYLKYKRTSIKKLFFLLPILVMLIVYLMYSFMPKGYMEITDFIMITGFNWWTVLFIPIGTAVLVGLVNIMEKKVGNYKVFVSRNLSLQGIWISKVFVICIFMFYSIIILAFLIVFFEILLGGQIKLKEILSSVLVIWVGSINLVPIYLFLSIFGGLILNVIVGFIGFFIGAVMAIKSYWMFVPWSLSLRMLSPILKVHPNGIPLKANDFLLDTSVIKIGLFFSIMYFVVFTFITSLWFKKEVIK